MILSEFIRDAQAQTQDRASRIVARILSELWDRRGFDGIFGNMDEDAVEEMVRTHRQIVVSEVTQMGRVVTAEAETRLGLGGG